MGVSRGADDDESAQHKAGRRICQLMICILFWAALSFGLASVCTIKYPTVLANASLAFTLGLRHAVDVDHLAAIDNVTRQLLSRGQKPVSVGFWFAVGHSSIVVMLTALIAAGYSMLFKEVNHGTATTERIGLIASVVSVLLLAGIGCLNLKIALDLFKTWSGISQLPLCEAQNGAVEELGQDSARTAILSIPFLQRLFEKVDCPEKMFLVGFLFGLGFDTATQVGVIGLAAVSGSSGGMPPWMVMIFPLCFSCGMILVDTTNGWLMLLTYQWATVRPSKKIFYNFVVTALSGSIALIIGSIEMFQIIGRQYNLHGLFWDSIQSVGMAHLGCSAIAVFICILLASVCFEAMNDWFPQRNGSCEETRPVVAANRGPMTNSYTS